MVVPPPTRFGVDTLGTLFGPRILGVESGVLLSMLLIQSLISSFSCLVIVSLIHGAVFTRSVQYKLPRSAIFCSAEPVSRYKSDLRLQSRRSVRKILRPIRRRFVIFANAGFSGICPIWICTYSSLPSLLRCELRYDLFSSVFPRRAP